MWSGQGSRRAGRPITVKSVEVATVLVRWQREGGNLSGKKGIAMVQRDSGGFYLPHRRRGRTILRTTSAEDFHKDFSLPRLSMSRRPRSESVQTLESRREDRLKRR